MAAVIEQLEVRPYRLPLARVWGSARGDHGERRGWLLSARCGTIRGYGDCAPLPEAGTEIPEAAWRRLCDLRAQFLDQPLGQALEVLTAATGSGTPAADYALESALSDLTSRLAGTTLRGWLDADATESVPVNASLGPLSCVNPADLECAAKAGFRVLKLKVGIGEPDRELERLAELAAALPDGCRLRLDANGAWDSGTASRVIRALNRLPVESLEEPLRVPDWPALASLQRLARFPLALDESIPPLRATLDLTRFPVRRAVLKPAAIGGLRRTLMLAQRLDAAGIEVVITSLIESAAGLWPTAQLAAAIGSPIPQGLATADWLAEDLGLPPRPADGRLRLPGTAGSGFAPYDADTDCYTPNETLLRR